MLYANIHCHDDIGSVFDGVASPAEIVARLKEMGAKVACMTNHGTMVSTWDYIAACEKNGMKFIPGIEFYVEMPGTSTRRHMIALARSFKGYQAICKVVSETAYHNVDGYPIATDDMFKRWFGPGSLGYGEVIITSACMQGIIASYLLQNSKLDREIEKIRRKQKERPDIDRFNTVMDLISKNDEEAKTRRSERDENKKKSGDKDIYEAAVKRLEELSAENKKLKAERDALKTPCERYQKYENEISELEKGRVSERKAKAEAKAEAEKYLNLFGEGNFFIELQYHGIKEEAYCMPILANIAKDLGIPVVAANDSHMLTAEDAEKRRVMWAQKYSWKEIEPQDRELFIKTDEELAEWLCKILPKKTVTEAINNIKVIVDQCNVEFSAESHYPKFPCAEGAILHLRKLIARGKKKIQPWTDEYQQRLQHELNVIINMGFADYLCIIEDFLNYGRLVGKCDLNSQEFLDHRFDIPYLTQLTADSVGEGIGPGRGSACGSLVCYLVGITNIDPIKNDLLFERFLNPERVTMPDIDSDVAPEVRPYVIDYIKWKYGEKAVCQILTRGFFGAKSAINAGARVLGKKFGNDKMFVKLSYEITDGIEDADASIADVEADILARYPANDDVKEILTYAKMIEGRCQNYGTHAAGIIISDNDDVSDYLPLIRVTDSVDCSCDLNYVEPLGMLKLDLLGLRNLGIITECEKAIQRSTGEKISIDHLPEDPEVFAEIFSRGKTNGVFQFESDGMKKVLTQFKPENISDLTLLNAIFRPGPMQYVDEVSAVKNGEKIASYIVPEMADILGPTYGKPIYQEEIMAIFNKIAGFSLGESDIIRRHMAKKHYDEFAAYKDKFLDGLVNSGADRADAEEFWDELLDFSAYAFNKSHARAYAEVAYATAYLKYHYPEAYFAGLLNYTSNDKKEAVLTEALANGVNIVCPNINIAEENFTLFDKTIVYGLGSVTQVAASAKDIVAERKANGLFSSFTDFLERCNPRKNVLENLINAGAFDCFSESREGLRIAAAIKTDALADRKRWAEKLTPDITEKKRMQVEAKLTDFQSVIDEEIPIIEDDRLKNLKAEKEVLGNFISSHPVPEKTGYQNLESTNYGHVAVYISDVEMKQSKSGNAFANVYIEDRSGAVRALAFKKTIDKCAALLKPNCVVDAFISRKEDGSVIINDVSEFHGPAKDIRLLVSTWTAFKQNEKLFAAYKGNHRLIVHCASNGKYYKTNLFVSSDIFTSEKIKNI